VASLRICLVDRYSLRLRNEIAKMTFGWKEARLLDSSTSSGQFQMERRLSAILSADVVGFSRLMGLDEVGTLTSLKAHRRELIDCKIAEHHGRIVKVTGDGMLVEFPSVVNAVACSAEIQRAMPGRNEDVPQA
jgi:class 3 adenylate cyclase